MDLISYLNTENRETVEVFNKIFSKLVSTLSSEEREALQWFTRGLRAKTSDEKQECYQKTRQILGGFLLK